jgi:ATP-binding cassette subfamily C (CFTR/MRP) protein 1
VCIGSGYVAATIPLCIGLVYIVQFFYLRTSRQLRLLDIEAKAPLFSQFLETRDGVSCIRAFGWTQDYMERSYDILDTSQKPFYLLKSLQRWLNLVLNLLVAGIAILLVALATNVRGATTGFLGVALFNVMNFSTALRGLVSEWTGLEMTLGAINRIRSYVLDTESEDLDSNIGSAPENWPKHGDITFDNVSASYQSSLEPILQKVSLSILPGEKIAICGRTGR